MTEETLKRDMAGIGKKMTEIEVSMAKEQVKTQRNSDDIQAIWKGVKELTKASSGMLDKISQKNNALLMKIIFTFAGMFVLLLLKDHLVN